MKNVNIVDYQNSAESYCRKRNLWHSEYGPSKSTVAFTLTPPPLSRSSIRIEHAHRHPDARQARQLAVNGPFWKKAQAIILAFVGWQKRIWIYNFFFEISSITVNFRFMPLKVNLLNPYLDPPFVGGSGFSLTPGKEMDKMPREMEGPPSYGKRPFFKY